MLLCCACDRRERERGRWDAGMLLAAACDRTVRHGSLPSLFERALFQSCLEDLLFFFFYV